MVLFHVGDRVRIAKYNSIFSKDYIENWSREIFIIDFLYGKDPYEGKYHLLINKRESIGLKYLNDSKAFIECLNDIGDIYKNIEECKYNPNKNKEY